MVHAVTISNGQADENRCTCGDYYCQECALTLATRTLMQSLEFRLPAER